MFAGDDEMIAGDNDGMIAGSSRQVMAEGKICLVCSCSNFSVMLV